MLPRYGVTANSAFPVQAGELVIEGETALTRRIGAWLRPSVFAGSGLLAAGWAASDG
jgi:hypothetical protein